MTRGDRLLADCVEANVRAAAWTTNARTRRAKK